MPRMILVVALLSLLAPNLGWAQDVTVTPDVVYGHKYGMALTFDVFEPANANGAMFEKQIARSSVPVVVDVWAPWCGPCRMMAPAFEKAAQELEPEIRFLKLNSDEEQAAAGRLGIRGIPTLLLYRDGKEVARQSGAMSAGQITAWVRQHMRVGA